MSVDHLEDNQFAIQQKPTGGGNSSLTLVGRPKISFKIATNNSDVTMTICQDFTPSLINPPNPAGDAVPLPAGKYFSVYTMNDTDVCLPGSSISIQTALDSDTETSFIVSTNSISTTSTKGRLGLGMPAELAEALETIARLFSEK